MTFHLLWQDLIRAGWSKYKYIYASIIEANAGSLSMVYLVR